MPSSFRAPPPAPASPARRGVASFVWVAGLLLAAAGIVYAAVDVSNGNATTGAADGSFAPPTPAVEPDLVRPVRAASPARASGAATPAPVEDPLAAAAARAERQREADRLIEQLKAKLRAEREARRLDRREAGSR